MSGWVTEARADVTSRLASQILDTRGDLVWVHGPIGYGKLALRDHLIAAGATNAGTGAAQLLPDEVLAAAVLPQTGDIASNRLVAFSRVAPPTHLHPSAVIGPDELSLVVPDSADPVAGNQSSFVIETAHGWPAYAEALASGGSAMPSASPVNRGPLTSALIDRCLAGVDQEHRRVFAELAPLDRISDRVVAALSSDVTVRSGQLSGLPLVRQPDGWHVLLEPVRSAFLAETRTLERPVAERISGALTNDAGRVGAGLIFARAGRHDSARDLLAEMLPHDLDESDQGQLRALLSSLIDTEKDDGTLSLLLARTYFNRGALNLQRRALETARDTAVEQLRPETALEAEAELLNLDLPTLPLDDAETRLRSLQERAKAHSNRHTRVRLAEITSTAVALDGAATGQLDLLYDAARSLRDVADDWELAGERARAAATLRLLASTCLMHVGRYTEGMAVAKRALDLTHDQPNGHTKSLALLGFFTALTGDAAAFELVQQQQDRIETSGLSFEWTDAYRRWSEMWMAAFNGNAALVRQAQRETRARLGDLFRHQTGSVFLCDAAACLALVDDASNARETLREASDRDDVEPIEAGIAEIVVEARVGDPARVKGLVDDLHRNVDVPAERAWRLELECVLASYRATGQWDEEPLNNALLEAERFGLSELAVRLLARAGRSVDPQLRLSLFGQFRAFRGTERVDVPTGNTTALIELLAVRKGPVHIDVVVDHLWPDADVARGRNRLRNSVNRARSALGHDAIVRDGQTLSLAPSVETDLRLFDAAIQEASATPLHVQRATEALDLYVDHLLATDLYSDWLLPERESYRASAEGLISRLLEDRLMSTSDLLTYALRTSAMPRVIESIEAAAKQQDDAVTATACRAELDRLLLT